MIGSLIWVASLPSTYYAFTGMARQGQVLAADQVFEDFKQSGMNDLRVFIMQDYLCGVFFHLLFGIIVAGNPRHAGCAGSEVLGFPKKHKIWQTNLKLSTTTSPP